MSTRSAAVLLLCVLLCGCSTPGTDRRGRTLQAAGDKIVAAVEKHRASAGAYPTSLAELPEKFDLGTFGGSHYFIYKVTPDGFMLIVDYRPSWPNYGRVSCDFSQASKAWTCHGYL